MSVSQNPNLARIEAMVKQCLALPNCPQLQRHIAGILLEEPPINPNDISQMIQDFLTLFRIESSQAKKRCDNLYAALKKADLLNHETNKFSLSADKLDSSVVLENVLSMQDARQPMFAKKPTAGNSNTEMSKWRKKDKGKDKQKDKAIANFEKHLKEIEQKKKELPPVQIRRERLGTGKNNDLVLDNIHLTIAGKTLLQQTNLKLAYGRKYGLVGRNGIGKTCLMNALARSEFPKMPNHLQILLVEQQLRDVSKPVIQTVLETDIEREELMAEQEQLSMQENSGAAGTKRMNEIMKRLEQIEAHKAEARAAIILGGLGFTPDMLSKPVGSLSGGWRMRVALARALFVEPEVLLLDEPTNHLDLDAVMWLQDYICNCKGTVVIVSHARQFLNVTCNEIIHFFNEKLDYYRGNYDTFEKIRIESRERNRRQVENQQMKLEHMQAFIDKFRFNAKRASLVQSRIKAINKMQLVQEIIEDPSCVFIFPTPDKLRPPLLKIQDGYFGYSEDKYILRNVNFAIDMESRIAIVGANGVGKSTLLKLMVGSLDLTSGNSYRNSRLGLSMFTQHHTDQLKLPLSPLEQFIEDFPGSTQQTYRSHLGSFGVTGTLALRPNYLLSGGQKSRVAFALAMWKNPHILVLDEPTNHLDIDAVNALIIALNNYQGGVIIVSHDQHLISTVCQEIWYIKDTRLKKFMGDFEDYRRQLAQGKL